MELAKQCKMLRQQSNDDVLLEASEQIKGKFKRGLHYFNCIANLSFTCGQGQLGKRIYGGPLS